MLWVALAGPAANLLMAILWVISMRLYLAGGLQEGYWYQMAMAGVNVNLVLMALNLLPILPLDGGRILFSLLPNPLAWQYSCIEPSGLVTGFLLFLNDFLWIIFHPFLQFVTAIL